jgi:chemotaxis protein methyltransferase CheR
MMAGRALRKLSAQGYRAGRGDQVVGHAGRGRHVAVMQRRAAAFGHRTLSSQGRVKGDGMNVTDFEFICQILRERSGLVLTSDKAYLLESRLLPVARKWKLAAFDDLVRQLRTRMEEAVIKDVVEAMTTNESFFFRDAKPFEQFKSVVMPHMLRARASTKTLRIWSAACSSGQEPYSLAMIIAEMGTQLAGWRVDIVGTDLSTEILQRAGGPVFQFEVQRLPITMLVGHHAVERPLTISQKISRWSSSLFNLQRPPSALRCRLLPECPHLLRSVDQGARPQQYRPDDVGGRISVPGRGRDRARDHRPVPTRAEPAGYLWDGPGRQADRRGRRLPVIRLS